MTAVPFPNYGDERVANDPVLAIMSRIESARSRMRRRRAAATAYALFDEGRLVGTIDAPRGAPVFGPAAPTVLLTRHAVGGR